MTEDVRDHFERNALSQHQRCCRVPQLVWMPVSEPGALAERREVVPEVGGVDGRADGGGEDQGRVRPSRPCGKALLGLMAPVGTESINDLCGNVERTARSRGLDRAEHQDTALALERLPDDQRPRVEVEVVPR